MKWEYLVNTYKDKNDDQLQAELDEAGGDGWEIVSVHCSDQPMHYSGSPKWVTQVFFKRPKRDGVEKT